MEKWRIGNVSKGKKIKKWRFSPINRAKKRIFHSFVEYLHEYPDNEEKH